MRKIFDYASPRAHYHNEQAFLWCSDQRFEGVHRAFMSNHWFQNADPIIIPGGVKNLVTPKFPRDTDFILEQIELLMGHGFRELYAMAHNDCAACGGNTDPAYYEDLLRSAAEVIRARISGLKVYPIYAAFDGLYLVE